MKKGKVIFLLGPTASGKTSFSVRLAKDLNGEIISADSVQVFKGFNIGSAKVTEDEMDGVKHYGIDIKDPNENFSASEYVDYTKCCIDEILRKNKTPIIVGGTGLYVKALALGYNFGGTAKNEQFRMETHKLISEKGVDFVIEMIKKKNPALVEGIDKNNEVRVVRALEIATFGSEKTKSEPNYEFKLISTSIPREKLYQNINKRVQLMVDNGLIEEVKSLYETYGFCQPMTAIGYKEVIPFIEGKITKKELIDKIAQNTRHYAKRQMTFLRGMDDVEYIDLTDEGSYERIKEELKKWLNK